MRYITQTGKLSVVFRSRTCSGSMSVHGPENLMKGKECTRREEAGRRRNKPLLTHSYGLEKSIQVLSTVLANKV